MRKEASDIKKGDKIITAVVLLTAVILIFVINFSNISGKTVVIKSENEILYEVSLSKNRVIELDGNTVEIKNGCVDVTKADCKNQICVKHKKISKKGESIVCLPNRVIVEIK